MLSNFVFTLADFSEIIAAVVAGGGLLWVAFEWRGSKVFVTKESVKNLQNDIDERLDEMQLQGQKRGEKIEHLASELERLPSLRDIQNADRRTDAIERRTALIESRLEELPDKDSLHQLALSISELSGDLRATQAQIKPLAQTVSRIDDFLRKQGH